MRTLFIGILMGFVFAGMLFGFYTYNNRPAFPPNMLRNYEMKVVEHAFIPGSKDLLVVIGFEAKDLFQRVNPRSILAVYKVSGDGPRLIYRFSPVAPKDVNYPGPLMIEQAKIVWDRQKGLSIFTSWGETGADYWGSHPILFAFKRGKPFPVSFYDGALADDPRIKDISWTRKDFIVKNLYDNSQEVKTILTQGVQSGPDRTIELAFYGDNLPHASDHKIVKFRFKIP